MILTGSEIKKKVLNGEIHIRSFILENINPNSYNYRLGYDLYELDKSKLIDAKRPVSFKKIKLTNRGYTLKPGRLYLSHTYEEIGSDKYLTILIGRSSVGRLGLFLQITSDIGHIGSKHCWTLELYVVQPLVVYPLMKIGQVSFWTVKGKNELNYVGKYQKYSTPHISEIYKELN